MMYREDNKVRMATSFQERVYEKFRDQIAGKPDYGDCKKALKEFDWDPKWLLAALGEKYTELRVAEPSAALSCVLSAARRLGTGKTDRAHEVSVVLLAQVAELETELEKFRMEPEKNAKSIDQIEDVVRKKKASLAQLQG